jgi:Ras-related protein Rab-1A
MIGDSGVGKSCLLKRFSSDEFESGYISTIGVDFEIRTMNIQGKVVKLQIWDTAGQERFHNITTSYYRGAHCIILVYDITQLQTFRSLPRWRDQIKEFAHPDVQVLLVGNKCDLEDKREVSFEDALEMAKEFGLELIETSAKESINVEKAFVQISTSALQTKIQKLKELDGRGETVTVGKTNAVDQQKTSCCG